VCSRVSIHKKSTIIRDASSGIQQGDGAVAQLEATNFFSFFFNFYHLDWLGKEDYVQNNKFERVCVYIPR